MNLELHATPQEVMRAVEAWQQFAQQQGVSEKVTFGLALALEECASNIVNHALLRDAEKNFSVQIDITSNSCVIELRDRGAEFDPTAVPPGKCQPDDVPGGWGIQLVRRYTDEIQYARQEGENVLRLVKHLAPGESK